MVQIRTDKGMIRREFLGWLCKIGGGCSALTLGGGLVPLRKINTVLLSEAHAANCNQDTCATSDSGGECTTRDVCDADSSDICTNDECTSDKSGLCSIDKCAADNSGGCTNDECISDSSGDCSNDSCRSDKSGGCTSDSCGSDSSKGCETDYCVSDSSGECLGDSCQSDSSGECVTDTCQADSSGGCKGDNCVSDSSGYGAGDECIADSSGSCVTDFCRSDKSGSCKKDNCISDSSGANWPDGCEEDLRPGSQVDFCISDSSGACFLNDSCTTDASDVCNLSDSCVRDSSGACDSDLCRDDRGDVCTSDTCALDLTLNQPTCRRQFAKNGLNQALKMLYKFASVVLFMGFLAGNARAGINAADAAFSPAPDFVTGHAVSVPGPVGPFLRDCDNDGILEADVNGDGQCAGDPELKDYNGDGSLELPNGTQFSGSFQFTCFFIPYNAAIIATGPLTVAAADEFAVFGAVRLPNGGTFSCPGNIDLHTSAWLAETGSISFTTTAGPVITDPESDLTDEVPTVDFVSSCLSGPSPASIPALSEWGMIVMAVLLMVFALSMIRHERSVNGI